MNNTDHLNPSSDYVKSDAELDNAKQVALDQSS